MGAFPLPSPVESNTGTPGQHLDAAHISARTAAWLHTIGDVTGAREEWAWALHYARLSQPAARNSFHGSTFPYGIAAYLHQKGDAIDW